MPSYIDKLDRKKKRVTALDKARERWGEGAVIVNDEIPDFLLDIERTKRDSSTLFKEMERSGLFSSLFESMDSSDDSTDDDDIEWDFLFKENDD